MPPGAADIILVEDNAHDAELALYALCPATPVSSLRLLSPLVLYISQYDVDGASDAAIAIVFHEFAVSVPVAVEAMSVVGLPPTSEYTASWYLLLGDAWTVFAYADIELIVCAVAPVVKRDPFM